MMEKSFLAPIALPCLLVLSVPSSEAQEKRVEYYHVDLQGNVRAVTNEDGTVIERYDYLPFGAEWNPSVSDRPLRFSGKERDVETGLDYFGRRYYGSRLGRFTTTDPLTTLRKNRLDPQRWNRYTYVRNNPFRYVDPDGRELRTTQLQRMTEIGGLGTGKLDIVDGVLDVSGIQSSDLEGNEGALLLFQLANSSNVYTYGEGTTIETAGGARAVSGISVLDNRPDARYDRRGGKSPMFRPASGIDASVVIDPNVLYITQLGRKPVSRRALAFHELAEAYGRVDKGLNYEAAHAGAAAREKTLVGQRPDFTQGLAGDLLERVDKTKR